MNADLIMIIIVCAVATVWFFYDTINKNKRG